MSYAVMLEACVNAGWPQLADAMRIDWLRRHEWWILRTLAP